ncbi:discoidin domain-containing protein [Cohnella mopanensis]|uniref:discoidin domain-containing protein n=1 Tax=Cohnella mopanensis TaxID=2911966 RepID=UPI001EF8A128|nr:discoidin domain-containing protein [Cohnella mopanensis]
MGSFGALGELRKRIARVLLIAVICVSSVGGNALANGGPSDTVPNVTGGGIHFVQKKNVTLTAEDLSFVIVGDRVQINVAYTLTNHGKADQVAFAFPVDYYEQEYGCEPNCDYKASGFRILDGNQSLNVTNELITASINKIIDDEYIVQKASRVYKTNISFAKNETKVIKVSYAVNAGYVNWMDPYSVLDQIGERKFSYDLTPAGYWGDGKVDKLNITFDYRDIVKKGGSLRKLTLPYGQALPEGIFKVELKQADLKSLGEIKFQYEYEDYLKSKKISSNRISSKLVSSIKASSELGKSYDASKLLDRSLSTAWAEGAKGLGIGQKITIELKKNTSLSELRLMNGYLKSKETYRNNARVKSMRVESLIRYSPDKDYQWITREVYFEDKPFNAKAVADGNLYLLSDKLDYYEGEVKTIKLTLLDAYPGTKYEDTCLTELLLLY